MTLTISLSPTIEEKLRGQSKSTGKDISTLVVEAIEHEFGNNGAQANSSPEDAEKFDQLLDQFFSDNPEPLPALPPNFSRSDIYADHD